LKNEHVLTSDTGWFVSSYSNGNASCVQVKFAEPRNILVRDSKDSRSASPIISVPSHGWAALLANISDTSA
jgi:Domain of unknown function (DUF397)